MKNKIKLLLLSIITPLLCIGVSFGATYNLFENLGSNLILNASLSQQGNRISLVAGHYYCYYLDDSNYSPWSSVHLSIQSDPGYGYCSSSDVSMVARSSYCFVALCDNSIFEINNQSYSSATIKVYEFDEPLSIGGDCTSVENDLNVCVSNYNGLKSDYNTLSGNFNTCIDTLNTRNGEIYTLNQQISTLSGNLSTCQSDLSSCTNGCDVMVNQCQENLSGCTTNLDSMTNYANSLSDQLNQCLANSPDSCEGTGCDQISSGINVLFSFFWEREDQMFSLPISNNVFLPRGYRAYLDSGVVAITEYEKKSYLIDDTSFDEINKSFYSLIYGFIFLSAVALFCYYLKKFISKSFIPKEKKG